MKIQVPNRLFSERVRRTVSTVRLPSVALIFFLIPPPASAQPLEPGGDRESTLARLVEEVPVGLESLLRERDRWRPVSKHDAAPTPIEIDGLVVDQTQSKLARDFYEVFYARWRAPRGIRGFTIVIDERPLPNMGTMVSVEVNDRLVYRSRLQSRYDQIEEAAHEAVRFVARHLEQRGQR